MKHLLLTLSSILLIINLSNAQLMWDGGAGTNKWNDKANWVGDALPTATTNVLIDGPYNVELDADGFCASVELKGTSTLTIGGNATLTIEDFTPDAFHIKVNKEATLNNSGFIDINNKVSSTIINQGIFNNLALIEIEESAVAIRNESSGIITNNGDIQLFITGIGIMNEGSFRNDDVILIDSVRSGTNGYGINNLSEFINDNSGHITIMRTSVDAPGISIAASGTLTNGGTITIEKAVHGIIVFGNLVNNDSISIQETDIYPLINNGGTITNAPTGSIAILKNTEANSHGIWNWVNSTIDNNGTITVDSITGNGLLNEGICNVNGLLNIQYCDGFLVDNGDSISIGISGILSLSNTPNGPSGIGILNSDSGVVINAGTIKIASIDRYGIINDGKFTNQDSIFINNTSRDGIENDGRFINSGYFRATNNGDHSVLNNGFLKNVGTLNLEPVSGEYGLENTDTLLNIGTLVINNSKDQFIYNTPTGYLENSGFIDANKGVDGLYNDGTFINSNLIHLDSLSESGIWNSGGHFLNENGASILIKDSHDGITIRSASMLTNNGTINISNIERGILIQNGNLTNTSSIGISLYSNVGISISGTLNNDLAATLNIDNGEKGITLNGMLENKGSIFIDIMSEYGIRVNSPAILDQKSTGDLILQSISGDYFSVSTEAEVSILGELTFD